MWYYKPSLSTELSRCNKKICSTVSSCWKNSHNSENCSIFPKFFFFCLYDIKCLIFKCHKQIIIFIYYCYSNNTMIIYTLRYLYTTLSHTILATRTFDNTISIRKLRYLCTIFCHTTLASRIFYRHIIHMKIVFSCYGKCETVSSSSLYLLSKCVCLCYWHRDGDAGNCISVFSCCAFNIVAFVVVAVVCFNFNGCYFTICIREL